jgi:5-methylcytosine-specific restriction endonuclease McrA
MTLDERRARLAKRDREKLRAADARYWMRNRDHVLAKKRDRYRAMTPAQRDRVRERSREFERMNRARRAEKSRRYYLAHRSHVRARKKAWAQKNLEKIRAHHRMWVAANREKVRAWTREWERKHPEKKIEHAHRRRARLRGGGGRHSSAEWADLLRRYNNCCAYCGAAGKLERDHRVPICRGGSDFIGNILPACSSCNRAKAKLTDEEFRARSRGSVAAAA